MKEQKFGRQTILSDTKEIEVAAVMNLYVSVPIEYSTDEVADALINLDFNFSFDDNECIVQDASILDTSFELPDLIEETLDEMMEAYKNRNIHELAAYAQRLVDFLDKKNEL